MIRGTGVDSVEIERIAQSLKRFGPRFKDRFFTANEQNYCDFKPNSAQHYAARFAAKEAFAKALGRGIADGIRWVDVEVTRRKSGRPDLKLRGRARKLLKRHGKARIWLSLTHTASTATAFVVIESR